MLDKNYCEKLIAANSTKSPLAIMYDVDFRIKEYNYNLDPNCVEHIKNVLGNFDQEKINSYVHLFNNVAATQKITLEARK